MELLRWKTRISMLWVILAANFSAYLFLNLMESSTRKELLESQTNEATMARIAFLFFLPFVLAWLSQTLSGSAIRWTNLILGVLFVVGFVFEAIASFNAGRPGAITADIGLALVVCLLIAWYAWKWPKQEGELAAK